MSLFKYILYDPFFQKHENKPINYIQFMKNTLKICNSSRMWNETAPLQDSPGVKLFPLISSYRVFSVSAEAGSLSFASETLPSVQTIRLCKQPSVGD